MSQYLKFDTVQLPKQVLVPTKEVIDSLTNTIKESLLEEMYPIGSIKITANNINPHDSLGFGTWVEYAQGCTLVGVGSITTKDNVILSFPENSTGGYAKTKLLSHNHTINHTHTDNFVISNESHNHTINHGHSDNFSVASAGAHRHSIIGIASRVAGNTWDSVVASDNGAQDGDSAWTSMTSTGAHTHIQ